MGNIIPFGDELDDAVGEVVEVTEIDNPKSLATQNAKPLLHLIHPAAMHGGKVELETWVFLQPLANLFAVVRRDVVQNHMDRLDGGRDVAVDLFQELDELELSFAPRGSAECLSGASVEGREQIQGSAARVFVFDACGLTGLRGLRRGFSRTRLQAGHLIQTEHHLVRLQVARVEIADLLHTGEKVGVSRHFRGQPRVLPPRLETMARQHLPHRLDPNRGENPGLDQLPPNLRTVPLRQ